MKEGARWKILGCWWWMTRTISAKRLIKRLQKRNLDVSGAENGEKALEMIDKFLYDVVILDVKMPGIDGIETLRRIKAEKTAGRGDHAHRPCLG